MKSLALYIDNEYIVGAVYTEGNTRPVKLPNNEDRVWLFFHEDTTNDTVSYGKDFKNHYRNRENHYYGEIFTNLTTSDAKFTMFKRLQPIKDIFKMGKVFDDLKAAVDNEDNIPTYLSFSTDIGDSACRIFREELEKEKFQIKESRARIDLLALEYAAKNNGFSNESHYLVLNACNENLHYSIYKKSGDIFLLVNEHVLPGMGTDLRSRCLIEHIIDKINQTEHLLKTKEEKETEYLRCSQLFAKNWILKISNARPNIPVTFTTTLSKDPYKEYSISVKKRQIDERTETVARNLVDEIVKFVQENGIRQITGIIYLGNTFTNKQFSSLFLKHYNLRAEQMILYMDKDLPMLVSAYNFIDCNQYIKLKTYHEKLQQAKTALDGKDFELARQKAEEALDINPKSKEARHIKDTANRRLILQKDFDRYIDRADTFIAEKLYKKATDELEKARELGINDEVVQNRFGKINALKSRIDKLSAQLNKAIKDKDYKEATLVCGKLKEEDPANQIKWAKKLSEIKSMQQVEIERKEKIRSLRTEIGRAEWNEDWKKVIEKCRALLDISQEDDIKEKLAVAENKLREIEEVDNAISEIEDLIDRGKFKDAKTKLDLLSKGKRTSNTSLVNNPKIQSKIRELRQRLFPFDFDCKSGNTQKPSKDFFGD